MAQSFAVSSARKKRIRTRRFVAFAFCFASLFFALFGGAAFTRGAGSGGERAGNTAVVAFAEADPSAAFRVNSYFAEVTVNADRTVNFHETIDVTMQTSAGTQFYRSLPIDAGDAYFNISARKTVKGVVDTDFSVIDNPDDSSYIDIVCPGRNLYGEDRVYEFFYTLRSSEKTEDSMTLDVVGGGWTVALNEVNVVVNFPAAYTYEYYSGEFGSSGTGNVQVVAAEERCLKLYSPCLRLTYNTQFGDTSACAITLRFSLESGVLRSYSAMLLSSPVFWLCLFLAAGVAVGAFFLTFAFKKDREIVKTVSVKPPEGLDPMQMGLIIDGSVDTEDITSMIYYFSDQGYLTIELPEKKGDDPILHRTEKPRGEDMPSWQETLLDGLFDGDYRDKTEISDLKEKFYKSADEAKTQISARKGEQYEKKSLLGMVICALLAVCLYEVVPLFVGLIRIGGGYLYKSGLIAAAPIALSCAGFFLAERRRYKDKATLRFTKNVVFTVILVVFGGVYTAFFARHILTVYERLFLAIGATVCAAVAPRCISRTEKYVKVLGDILGFKDFIVYTEEDKIEFMLEQNPQLYYDVLPYAQVLGVTDAWEKKFEKITIEPPQWCVGCSDFSLFEYMVFNRMLRNSFLRAMSRPEGKGGTFLGGGGGGGSFGGFSGGGHGGGGGGIR